MLVFDSEKFSKVLRVKRRAELNITLREAEEVSGIGYATLSRCENGGIPDLITYARLCQWASLDLKAFFVEEKSKKENII